MPKYRIVCFSEDIINVGKLRITALKPTLEKEVTSRSVMKLDGSEDEIYRRLKEHIYGVECQKLLIASAPSTRKEPNEILVNLAGRYSEYVLHPKISKVIELSILERQDTDNIEENVIVAKMLKEQKVPVQNPFYIQEGRLEVSADGGRVVGVKLITDCGERILLVKEKAVRLPSEKKKTKKKRRARKKKASRSKKAKTKSRRKSRKRRKKKSKTRTR